MIQYNFKSKGNKLISDDTPESNFRRFTVTSMEVNISCRMNSLFFSSADMSEMLLARALFVLKKKNPAYLVSILMILLVLASQGCVAIQHRCYRRQQLSQLLICTWQQLCKTLTMVATMFKETQPRLNVTFNSTDIIAIMFGENLCNQLHCRVEILNRISFTIFLTNPSSSILTLTFTQACDMR